MSKKYAVIDTETTGLNRDKNDRVIDIAAVLIDDRDLVGQTGEYSQLCNPQRDIPHESFNVHKISQAMVANQPLFKDIADDFLAFIEGRTLIIHNAKYDLEMIDQEFSYFRPEYLFSSYFEVIDTIKIARKKHPNSRYSLNNLLKLYGMYDEEREAKGHSALHDCQLTAALYLQLTGGQEVMKMEATEQASMNRHMVIDAQGLQNIQVGEDEIEKHMAFMDFISEESIK